MTKIIHDKKKCSGCGTCIAICPLMFDASETGVAHLKNSKEVDGFFELETDDTESIKDCTNICEFIKIV